jgi:hypothetical protein
VEKVDNPQNAAPWISRYEHIRLLFVWDNERHVVVTIHSHCKLKPIFEETFSTFQYKYTVECQEICSEVSRLEIVTSTNFDETRYVKMQEKTSFKSLVDVGLQLIQVLLQLP